MNHLNRTPNWRPSANRPDVRTDTTLLSTTVVVMEHPTLTRAREVLGTVSANSPHARLRAGSFAFFV